MANLASPSLYHWFCGNFLRYGGPLTPADLPVDNHELIALSAPRPLFIGGGSNNGDGYAEPGGDAWADPKGMFLAEVAAGPVYKLLGAKDLGISDFPAVGPAIDAGDLAWGTQDITFDFHEDGSSQTGKVTTPRGESDISDGKIDGDSITFTQTVNFNGNELKINYAGKVDGHQIKFTRTVADRPPVEFTATRAK